jgi:hypothetical protein
MTAEERYAALVDVLLADPDVSEGDPDRAKGRFGSSGLKVRSRIFAMLVRGSLVLKLPAPRVDGLIASRDGAPFDANRGRPMREWVTLDPESKLDWLALAREALEFVRG